MEPTVPSEQKFRARMLALFSVATNSTNRITFASNLGVRTAGARGRTPTRGPRDKHGTEGNSCDLRFFWAPRSRRRWLRVRRRQYGSGANQIGRAACRQRVDV